VHPLTDGVVTLRALGPGDIQRLVDGRDGESMRWLGMGDPDPRPTACIVVDGDVVGWIDHDHDRDWLLPGEVNIGYELFPLARRAGYGTRALMLLMHHLSITGAWPVATLLIHSQNERSLQLARRAGFEQVGDLDGNPYFKKPVPPLTYDDGAVAICFLGDDAGIERGITWEFSIAEVDAGTLGHAECDFGGAHVPRGEACVTYTAQPGPDAPLLAGRAVQLIAHFLHEHSAARRIHHVLPPPQ
jgi:RimJ/RimL family protein N-acetyltransferase